jgi:hypothetical protein
LRPRVTIDRIRAYVGFRQLRHLCPRDPILLAALSVPPPEVGNVARSTEEAKDQSEHNRENYRRHDRKIHTNISVWTLILYVTWQKR